MKEYDSNDDFFRAYRELVQRIEISGNNRAAEELQEVFPCLNGLTDGWALLMESIEKVPSIQFGELEEMHKVNFCKC
jgi:hypothetical protein